MITFRYYIRNDAGDYLYLDGGEIKAAEEKTEAKGFIKVLPYTLKSIERTPSPVVSIVFEAEGRSLLLALKDAYASMTIDKAFLWLDKETTGTPTETPIMIDAFIGSLGLDSITDIPENGQASVNVQMQPLEAS